LNVIITKGEEQQTEVRLRLVMPLLQQDDEIIVHGSPEVEPGRIPVPQTLDLPSPKLAKRKWQQLF
jgi:hypothetical protein